MEINKKILNEAHKNIELYKKITCRLGDVKPEEIIKFTKKTIHAGDVYLTWKDFCEKQNIKYDKNPTTKNKYLLALGDICDYKIEGNKIIIINLKSAEIIRSIRTERRREQITTYTDAVEGLLSTYVYEAQQIPIALSYTEWFIVLGMINTNWKIPTNNEDGQSSMIKNVQNYDNNLIMNVKECAYNLGYFYETSQSQFQQVFQRAQSKLRSKFYIKWEERYIGRKIEEPEDFEYVEQCLDSGEDIDVKNLKHSFYKALTPYESNEYIGIENNARNERGNRFLNFYEGKKLYNEINKLTFEKIQYINVCRNIVAYSKNAKCLEAVEAISGKESIKKLINEVTENKLLNKAILKQNKEETNINNLLYDDNFYEEQRFLEIQKALIQILIPQNEACVAEIKNIVERGIDRGKEILRIKHE